VVATSPSSSPASASTIAPVQIEQSVAPAAQRSRSQAASTGQRPRGSKSREVAMSPTTTISAAGPSAPCGASGSPTGVAIGAPSRETIRGASLGAVAGSPVSSPQVTPTAAKTS
jgi:hypothetical protein